MPMPVVVGFGIETLDRQKRLIEAFLVSSYLARQLLDPSFLQLRLAVVIVQPLEAGNYRRLRG